MSTGERDMQWRLVPVKPTPEMIEAGGEANPTDWNEGTDYTFPSDVAEAVYRAMLAAAPQPAPAGEPVVTVYAYYGPKGPEVSAHVTRPEDFQVINDRTTQYPLYTTPPTVDTGAVRRAALEEAAKKLAGHLRLIADSMEERCSGFYPDDLREIAAALLTEARACALAPQPAPPTDGGE
ncbi:hypothetical protein ACO2RV_16895 [Ancylobacter sp. VNQ12]|uniref:hypothetical protein n=1 Tax=Ancylobacter sp. VNQ12 TaxID=3400920 RepID=UPI003C1097D6